MKIILLQDVPKVGKKWEIRTVANGYARNYLFPKRLAKAATPAAILELEQINKETAAEAEKELAGVQRLATQLDGLEIEMPTRVSEKGESYSAISAQKIAQVLQSMGYEIKKDQVVVSETIKKIGKYPVVITLKHGLEAEISVIVVEEKEKSENEKKDDVNA